VNKKAREGAFTLLVAVGESMQRWSPAQDRDSVIRLVQIKSLLDSFNLLVVVGESMQRWSPAQDRDSVIRLAHIKTLVDFFTLLLWGSPCIAGVQPRTGTVSTG